MGGQLFYLWVSAIMSTGGCLFSCLAFNVPLLILNPFSQIAHATVNPKIGTSPSSKSKIRSQNIEIDTQFPLEVYNHLLNSATTATSPRQNTTTYLNSNWKFNFRYSNSNWKLMIRFRYLIRGGCLSACACAYLMKLAYEAEHLLRECFKSVLNI